MDKTSKVTVVREDVKASGNGVRRPKELSLDKAKALIRKTSAEHAELFRKLAK